MQSVVGEKFCSSSPATSASGQGCSKGGALCELESVSFWRSRAEVSLILRAFVTHTRQTRTLRSFLYRADRKMTRNGKMILAGGPSRCRWKTQYSIVALGKYIPSAPSDILPRHFSKSLCGAGLFRSSTNFHISGVIHHTVGKKISLILATMRAEHREHLHSPTSASIATAPCSSMLHVVNFRGWQFRNAIRNGRILHIKWFCHWVQ